MAVLATFVYLALQTRQNTLAIGAQLDASRLGFLQATSLTQATSNELQEALIEDMIHDVPINRVRREMYWFAECSSHQWQLTQARKGILPSFNEEAVAGRVINSFTTYRSLETWWEVTAKQTFGPEYVEWVENLRSKAASR